MRRKYLPLSALLLIAKAPAEKERVTLPKKSDTDQKPQAVAGSNPVGPTKPFC